MAPGPSVLESPSPPRGEGRGEGGAWRGVAKGPALRFASRSATPSPSPLPGGERVSGTGECILAGFVVIAGLILAQPANAQSEAPKDTLKRVEQQLQTGKQRQQQLERQSQALQTELDDLRGRLIALADQARGQEQSLDQLEDSLAALEAEERERSAGLDAERQQIAILLAALQRLARIPPEAALARPESPVDTLRSALLLRDAVPALKARADALAQALAALADTRGKLVDQRAKALAVRVALSEKQDEMNRLIARREELSRQTEEERVQVGQRMAELSGQATDLRQLMERVEAERRAAIEAAARREAERREAERKEAARREAEKREAERRLAAQKEAERKAAERKLAELRVAEQKAAEQKAAEEKRAKDEAAREAARERELAAKSPDGPPAVAGMVLPAAGKYARSALPDTRQAEIAARLEQAMRDGRLYRDPLLSLSTLATRVAITPNHLSQTLNDHLGQSFFDYVNRWRVEEAVARIAASDEAILAIAYEVGFNSRSTFNTAVKKHAGRPPSTFRPAA